MVGTRLKELREDKDLRQIDIANKLGVQLRTYQKYEEGSIELKIAYINQLADFYGCTADYILGRTQHPHEGMLEFSIDNNKYKVGYDSKEYPKGIPTDQIEKLIEELKKMVE